MLLIRPQAEAEPLLEDLRGAVLKVYVTRQRWDYALPWQRQPPQRGTGSAFIINGRRILTNAHVVSDARHILVQKDRDPRFYHARVEFSANDCDLATLVIDDPSFFDDTGELQLAKSMPELNESVTVMGYPMGGNHLSVTRGVVSRIDYALYTHSGLDKHLVIQVDAAINPGNSGGPVMKDGKVTGLAFQGLLWGDNIGYAIPLPVIERFLADIDNGVYDGYPELGLWHMELRNPAMRTTLGIDHINGGVVVYYVDPFGAGYGSIIAGDVLMSIDGFQIADDGTIFKEGNRMMLEEVVERKLRSDSISMQLFRGGKLHELTISLDSPNDPFLFRNSYDIAPAFNVTGGLVFQPLSREILNIRDRAQPVQRALLAYYAQYAKPHGLYSNRNEFVVLTSRLPHPVNAYADSFINRVVLSVNNIKIDSLSRLTQGFSEVTGPYHVIRFIDTDDILILDAGLVNESHQSIIESYGIPDN